MLNLCIVLKQAHHRIVPKAWCVNFFWCLSRFFFSFALLHFDFRRNFKFHGKYTEHYALENEKAINRRNEKKKMESKRKKISKLSLSIFGSGQFININLFVFVIIYIFLHSSLAIPCFYVPNLKPESPSESHGIIRNRNNLIRFHWWLNNYLYWT